MENGLGGPLHVEGQDILALTPVSVLPGQRWRPGANGGVCWSGSSRTVGTNGARAQTARRTISPLGPPTVSILRCGALHGWLS